MTNERSGHGAREFSPRQRYWVLVLLVPVSLLLIPSLVVRVGAELDRWLRWAPVLPAPAHLIVGCVVLVPSWLFAMWAIYVQLTIGRGTPLPAMPTQQLIIEPPYTYCRNPMALGAIGMYLGVAILVQSLGAAMVVVALAGALLSYIKLGEEPQMEIRFGRGYTDYRNRTPFLIPGCDARRAFATARIGQTDTRRDRPRVCTPRRLDRSAELPPSKLAPGAVASELLGATPEQRGDPGDQDSPGPPQGPPAPTRRGPDPRPRVVLDSGAAR